jgi:UDP-N-acetylmuramyl pentapeptide phosphotransferase/UDP-N-acetylglucosamine-1-phosphate transferase
MATRADPALPPRALGATHRRDRWWLAPLLTASGLLAFGAYALVAAALGSDYLYTGGGARYLSPFYSPDLRSLFGLKLPFSFAFLVLWSPLGLRLTCYYYRKAYYRSFLLSPPACAVAGPRRRYRGEVALQNLHRYFLYFAIAVLGFLWYDAGRAFLFTGTDGSLHVGLGLGTLVLLANVTFLTAFTFGCNSLRHLVGGRLDCFTCSRAARRRHRLWLGVTVLNLRHKEWAWISLTSVGLADLYVRLASAGVFHDPRIF